MAQQHSRLQVGLILGSFESQPRDAEAPWDRPELATTAEESRWAVRGHGSRGKGKDRSHGGGGGVQRAENSNGKGCVLSVTLKLNAMLLSIMFVSSTLQYKQNL